MLGALYLASAPGGRMRRIASRAAVLLLGTILLFTARPSVIYELEPRR